MNIKHQSKHPHLFTLELKGIEFTMSEKELDMLKDLIILIQRNYD